MPLEAQRPDANDYLHAANVLKRANTANPWLKVIARELEEKAAEIGAYNAS